MLSVLLATVVAMVAPTPATPVVDSPDGAVVAEQEQQRQERNRNRGRGRGRGVDTDADTDSEDTDKDTDSDTDGRRGRRVCLDRNGDGMCDNRERRADRCVDANRDGFCDAGRRDDDDFCVDQDGDGRCDSIGFPARFPRTLPAMITIGHIGQGRRTADVNRWLGGARLRVRYADTNGDGTPELIRFLDPAGRVLQVWYDTDRDGRADRVEVYRDGKVARTVTREG